MKKSSRRFTVIMFIAGLMCAFLAGCAVGNETQRSEAESETQAGNSSGTSKIEVSGEVTPVESEPENLTPEENEEPERSEPPVRSVTIYYVDDLSAVVMGKKTDVTDEYDIWNALKEYGILTEDCELQKMDLNETDRTMTLDFNEATANRINSMGTTGETEITGCIMNTYLEAYDCTGIRLTVDGQGFVSSHGADFGKYSQRIVFE